MTRRRLLGDKGPGFRELLAKSPAGGPFRFSGGNEAESVAAGGRDVPISDRWFADGWDLASHPAGRAGLVWSVAVLAAPVHARPERGVHLLHPGPT